ncbi:MAG TPA: DUF554 domain-containing protein [Actinomycetales bacterium]|nr:DUF554 domain-containing protein [Actinomycetales bacterium]
MVGTFTGAGTVLNVVAVLIGAGLGVALGHRLPERTRDVVTDGLGLMTLVIAALSAAAVLDADLVGAIGSSAPVLIVLGSVVVGGIIGSALRLESRLEQFGGWLRLRLVRRRGSGGAARSDESHARFVQGFVTASLVFCVGPLTVLGSLSDGLGRGIDQLALKSTLDGFAAIAFAASFGPGVAASVVTVGVVQGSLTAVGVALGDVLPDAHVAALTATGGVLLIGVALRLLRVRDVAVADMLPALVVAPVLVEVLIRLP